jgi:membrane-bound metal-dependent hydrolase YbcI (DUF457 family)
MAGFKTHITVSTTLGVGYGFVGAYMGLPWESAVIAGGLCGIGGMLPDIDSDSGVPFREVMSFAAAIIPMFLLARFAELGLNHEQMVLAMGGSYFAVRFGIAGLLSKYTVHRGMFHSIPAALIFAGIVFLVSGSANLQLRYFKAAGTFLGVMSHLCLDEIYAIEFAHGRWRLKKSFGTALKLWGDSRWDNFSTYSKLVMVVMMILGEPMVMEQYGRQNPAEMIAGGWNGMWQQDPNMSPGAAPVTSYPPGQYIPPNYVPNGYLPENAPQGFAYQNSAFQNQPLDPYAPQPDRTIYDTARRLWRKMQGETK